MGCSRELDPDIDNVYTSISAAWTAAPTSARQARMPLQLCATSCSVALCSAGLLAGMIDAGSLTMTGRMPWTAGGRCRPRRWQGAAARGCHTGVLWFAHMPILCDGIVDACGWPTLELTCNI